ncbi:hypothetical protein EV702DRAFT_1041765 [Suillus placidus]|uniref:Uncharacterized protein n=1 Tax=Suillus placidus TaxID=48579 RepID=A0A9P7D7M4_9AGAM|nr:hypothetical protein EV702DRAFT_1041765 [Suillus placidus]
MYVEGEKLHVRNGFQQIYRCMREQLLVCTAGVVAIGVQIQLGETNILRRNVVTRSDMGPPGGIRSLTFVPLDVYISLNCPLKTDMWCVADVMLDRDRDFDRKGTSLSPSGAVAFHTLVGTYPLLEALHILTFVIPRYGFSTGKDKEDDEKAGVKSTAVHLGEEICPALSFLMCCTYLNWKTFILRLTYVATGCPDSRLIRSNDLETAERKKNEDKSVSAA